jgi:phosphoribosylanthranilate isomerase
VGVFVNASPDEVSHAVDAIGLDVAQLHGDEPVARYRHVASRLIKAVAAETSEDVQEALTLPPEVAVLVDAADRERRGGTGRTANWDRAADLAQARPIVLSGGLTAANIAAALRQVQPWGVDVSSGVEDAPGVKNPAKLREFFEAVRNANGD